MSETSLPVAPPTPPTRVVVYELPGVQDLFAFLAWKLPVAMLLTALVWAIPGGITVAVVKAMSAGG